MLRTAVRALAIGMVFFGGGLRAPSVQAIRVGSDMRLTAGVTITEKNRDSHPARPVCSLVDFKLIRRPDVVCVDARSSQAAVPQAGAPQAAAIRTGGTLFRERCADCHGAEAKGDRGPDLTGLWTSEAADGRAFQIIRSGVPGSIMPPSQAPDEDIRAVIAYLRSISTTAIGPGSRGNSANGERIFWSSCGNCHHVNDRGGRLGPDLSRIASSQSREALRRSIREASASISSGYEALTLVTREGQRIRGVRKGEDAFSIQIMDTRERLQGYLKADLRDVTRETQSLMPSFSVNQLSDAELDDLLDFLSSLRTNLTSQPGRP